MKELKSYCANRREKLGQQILSNGGGVAVVFSGAEIMRNRDADYPFRWDSYFYYLTGFTEPDSALAIVASNGSVKSVLFCREKNPERETWDGFRWGPEAAPAQFGLDQAHPIDQLDEHIADMLADKPALYYLSLIHI